MNAIILIVVLVTLALAGNALLLRAGFRVRERLGDARVTAVTVVGYPDEGTAEVAVTIGNSGDSPVIVGLSRRRPGLPGGGTRATAPCWTTRRRYRADWQAIVGTVPPGSVSTLPVLVPVRPCRLAIVIGQPGGRLLVVSVPVTLRRHTARQRYAPGGPGTITTPSSFSLLWPR